METITLILSVLNSIAILFIVFKLQIIHLSIKKDSLFWSKKLLGYNIWIGKLYFRISIRNKHKAEVREEVCRMISMYSKHANVQTLTAKFSWLQTWDEVRQFQKDYSEVDLKTVENLVSKFSPKTKA